MSTWELAKSNLKAGLIEMERFRLDTYHCYLSLIASYSSHALRDSPLSRGRFRKMTDSSD